MDPSSSHPHAVHAGRDSPQDKTCRCGLAGQRREQQERQQRELQHSLPGPGLALFAHTISPQRVLQGCFLVRDTEEGLQHNAASAQEREQCEFQQS